MNTLHERIMSLCEESGITGGKLCKDINIQRSVLTDLKMERKKMLSAGTLSKIADYFNVSVDYLMGKEFTEKVEPISEREQMSPTVQQIIDIIYQLSPEMQDLYLENLQILLRMQELEVPLCPKNKHLKCKQEKGTTFCTFCVSA